MGPFIFLVGWGMGGGGDFCLFVLLRFSLVLIFLRKNCIPLINSRRHILHLVLQTTLHNKRDLSINRHILLKIHTGQGPVPLKAYALKDVSLPQQKIV